MTRRFLGDEARGRFAEARIDAIRRLGAVAREQGCDFVVVCGDVFESNHVDRRTIVRANEAMAEARVPFVLLPGNHDPLDAASVFDAEAFTRTAPDTVHVLRDATPLEIVPGVEVVGAPWRSKHPDHDLVTRLLDALAPARGAVRIALGHGAVDSLSPDRDDPARIALEEVGAALDDGRIHYLALGDRHSFTAVGAHGRVYYAGSPEPTDPGEVDPGKVLVVDVDAEHVDVTPHAVGTWCFLRRPDVPLDGPEDLDALEAWLEGLPDKSRTIVRLGFQGALDLAGAARLGDILEHARDLFAAVTEREHDLAILPEDDDFDALGLGGFAAASVERLREALDADPDDRVARDALALLVRLAGAGSPAEERAR